MTQRKHERVVIDECPTCLGIYLDKGELEKIERDRTTDYSAAIASPVPSAAPTHPIVGGGPAEQHSVSCPGCDNPMIKRTTELSRDVLIDTCIFCGGIWLERGEMQTLEVAYERAHPHRDEEEPWQLRAIAWMIAHGRS